MVPEILVSDYRNNVLENIHPGHICGVDETGGIKFKIGDPEHQTFLRSAQKPFQAIPAIVNDIQGKFGLTDRETAIIAASHRGETFHIKELENLLKKVGISEEQLLCHPTYPLNPDAKDELLKKNESKRRLYHNCSGKHLGMIACAKALGVSVDGYWEPSHPVQKAILQSLSIVSGCKVDEIEQGVDGCGVPVYALPLSYIANAYLRLACPDLIEDETTRNAVTRITQLMNEHPELISGTNAICTCLLMDNNIVAKGGAQGVYCFGLKKKNQVFPF